MRQSGSSPPRSTTGHYLFTFHDSYATLTGIVRQCHLQPMCRLPVAYLYGQPIGIFLHTAVRGQDKVLICGSSMDLHTGFLLAPTYPSTGMLFPQPR